MLTVLCCMLGAQELFQSEAASYVEEAGEYGVAHYAHGISVCGQLPPRRG